MTEDALETIAPPAADSVPAPAPVDTATTPPSLEQPGVPVVVSPDGTTETLREFVGVDEPAEPELTDEQKNLKAYLDAETAWKTAFDADWPYERIDFHGDYLAVHTPVGGALAAVSLVSSKYVDEQVKTDLLGNFVAMHLGPESYGRFMTRMMMPHGGYGAAAFSDFITAISAGVKVDAEQV